MGEFLHILLQNGGDLNVKAPMLVLLFVGVLRITSAHCYLVEALFLDDGTADTMGPELQKFVINYCGNGLREEITAVGSDNHPSMSLIFPLAG